MGINPLKSCIDHIMEAGPGIRKADDMEVILTKKGLVGSDNNLTWLQRSRRPVKRPLLNITTINKGETYVCHFTGPTIVHAQGEKNVAHIALQKIAEKFCCRTDVKVL